LLRNFEGLSIVYVHSFLELVTRIREGTLLESVTEARTFTISASVTQDTRIPTFRDVAGQHAAKRALQIAAAGGHNLLMVGPPGGGKTMLAERIISIMPPLESDEFLEVNQIYSALRGQGVSELKSDQIIRARPFRSPHHSTSLAD
jgi:magnesium chelatase family protein